MDAILFSSTFYFIFPPINFPNLEAIVLGLKFGGVRSLFKADYLVFELRVCLKSILIPLSSL
jgi:hypothetical protein